VIAALLCISPESSSMLVTALQGQAEDDLMVHYTHGKLIDEYSPCVETGNLNEATMKVAAYEH
jgi:hypothetical protein